MIARIAAPLAASTRRSPLAVLLVVVALAAAALAPLALGNLRIELLTTFLVFGLVALSLDLVWGYTGILSMGQFAFFGIGAYAVALISNELIALERIALLIGIAAGIAAAMLLAFVLAYAFFSTQLGELFVLVTIALAIIMERIVVNQTELLGGINGILLPYWAVPTNLAAYYLIVLAVVMLVFSGVALLVRSPLGRVLQAIKVSEERAQFLGYDTKWYKVVTFSAAAGIAALGGGLYAILTGFVFPGLVGFEYSFDALVWTVFGGIGTLYGPILGTLTVNFAKFYTSDVLIEYWLLVVGSLFIAIVVFFPDGMVGLGRAVARRGRHTPLSGGRRVRFMPRRERRF
jgi:ABC-type branched-subunit amino acid transport system permease subunit